MLSTTVVHLSAAVANRWLVQLLNWWWTSFEINIGEVCGHDELVVSVDNHVVILPVAVVCADV